MKSLVRLQQPKDGYYQGRILYLHPDEIREVTTNETGQTTVRLTDRTYIVREVSSEVATLVSQAL